MALNETMVSNYLVNVRSLKAINNQDVKDPHGNKTGQLPLTIKIGRNWIDEILERDYEQESGCLTEEEQNSLFLLKEALDSLPGSLGFQSLMSLVSGLDEIQQSLFKSIRGLLANITHIEEHKLLLKAVVLVLKITEYDLSKKPGPITMGYGFFKIEVLSNEQRIENHTQVQGLLGEIIKRFEGYYESEKDNSLTSEPIQQTLVVG
jgi:hypothetical protein